MRADMIASLMAPTFRSSTASEGRSNVPSGEQLPRDKEPTGNVEMGGLDAYKVAVLLLVGAGIFSLFSSFLHRCT